MARIMSKRVIEQINLTSSDEEPESADKVEVVKKPRLDAINNTKTKSSDNAKDSDIIVLDDEEELIMKSSGEGTKNKDVQDSIINTNINSNSTVEETNSKVKFSTIEEYKTAIERLEINPASLKEFITLVMNNFFDLKLLGRLYEKLKGSFHRACQGSSNYLTSLQFKQFIEKRIKTLQTDSGSCSKLLVEVFSSIRSHKDNNLVDEKLDRLERIYKSLNKKIKLLEVEEVDFSVKNDERSSDEIEEDESSAYLKLARYKERAVKVYQKIQKLREEDVHCGQPYFSRLDFASSNHIEINRAINKKFHSRDKIAFPTYAEVESCVRKAIRKNDLNASIKGESELCFKELGNLLQRRRQQDLAYVHFCYLDSAIADPAIEDSTLEQDLQTNRSRGTEAMSQVIAKYVRLQETGYNPLVSEDSDDSHKADESEVSDNDVD